MDEKEPHSSLPARMQSMDERSPAGRPPALTRATNSDDQVIDLWLRGKSANSVEAYRRDTAQFFSHFGGSLHYARLDDLWDWHDALRAQGLSGSTISRKLAALKSLFSFAHRIGVLQLNVGAAMTLPKVPSKLAERILTEDETRLLLNDPGSNRNSVIVRLFYASGARVSEISGLTWSMVRPRLLADGTRTAQLALIGKGSKARSVVLSASTWATLEDHRHAEAGLGFGGPDDPVFRSSKGGPVSRQQLWRIVRQAAKRAGLPQKVSPHWLRHAHASHALDRGAPVHLVKDTLGHESLATTSKYAHARPDDSSGRYLDL